MMTSPDKHVQEHQKATFSDGVLKAIISLNGEEGGDEWTRMAKLINDAQLAADSIPFEPEDTTEVDTRIESCREAVGQLRYESFRTIAEAHRNLGNAYADRFWLNAKKSDAKEALGNLRRARSNAENLPEFRSLVTMDLSNLFFKRFNLFEALCDVIAARELLEEIEHGQGPTPDTRNKLAIITSLESKYIPCIPTINSQLEVIKNSLESSETKNGARTWYLEAQGVLLLRRSELEGSVDDSQNAITALQTALSSPTRAREDDWRIRMYLSTALRRRFQVFERDQDLNDAQSQIEQALQSEGLLRRQRGLCKLKLAETLYLKNDYDKSSQYFVRSKRELNAAEKLFYGVDTPLMGRLKQLQAVQLWQTSRLGSRRDDTARAVFDMQLLCQTLRQGLERTGWPKGFAESPFLATLGKLLLQQAYQSRDSSAMNKAIDILRRATNAVSEGVLGQTQALFPPQACGLIRALLMRIDAWNHNLDKREAQRLLQEAVRCPDPLSLHDKTELLLVRGMSVQIEREGLEESGCFQKAIDLYQDALDLGCRRPLVQSECRLSLAKAYKQRGERNKGQQVQSLADFRKAEEYLRADIEQLQQYSHSVMIQKSTLSRVLQLIHRLADSSKDGKEALELSYEVLRSSKMDKVGLMEAAERAGSLEIALHNDWEKAAQDFDLLVDILLEVATEGHATVEKKMFMVQWSRMPTYAAECALKAGRLPVEVLRRLETHRSIYWKHRLNGKTDLDKLRAEQPDLWQQLQDIRGQMHRSVGAGELSPGPVYYAQEHTDLVCRIQKCKEFEDFMGWKITSELLSSYCCDGPAVLFVHGDTCHALIATVTGVSKLLLPQFQELHCFIQFRRFRKAITNYGLDRLASQRELLDVLEWLWLVAAKPVLDTLGLLRKQHSRNQPPRIWWVSSGWSSLLPIHAAGLHGQVIDTEEACTVMDAVVSSYIPTLTALLYSRSRIAEIESAEGDEHGSALLLAMGRTPGHGFSDLLNAPIEVEKVSAVLERHYDIVKHIQPRPKTADAIRGLQSCSIAHFACHGQTAEDPLASELYFWDAYRAPFDVATLMNLDIRRCKLAYLSACESGFSSEWKLREEGLHLAGALQLAGIPNIVATWWKIQDQRSVQVAEDFYTCLMEDERRLDFRNVASALHVAVKKLRDKVNDPFVWGSYVHFGC